MKKGKLLTLNYVNIRSIEDIINIHVLNFDRIDINRSISISNALKSIAENGLFCSSVNSFLRCLFFKSQRISDFVFFLEILVTLEVFDIEALRINEVKEVFEIPKGSVF